MYLLSFKKQVSSLNLSLGSPSLGTGARTPPYLIPAPQKGLTFSDAREATPLPLTWRTRPGCRKASGWPRPPSSLLFVGSQGKGPFMEWILVQWGAAIPMPAASSSPLKAAAGRGRTVSALHPLPVKSPSGPPSAESWSIKPLAKEFGRAQYPPKRRGPCPYGSLLGLFLVAPPQLPGTCPPPTDSVPPPLLQPFLPCIPLFKNTGFGVVQILV